MEKKEGLSPVICVEGVSDELRLFQEAYSFDEGFVTRAFWRREAQRLLGMKANPLVKLKEKQRAVRELPGVLDAIYFSEAADWNGCEASWREVSQVLRESGIYIPANYNLATARLAKATSDTPFQRVVARTGEEFVLVNESNHFFFFGQLITFENNGKVPYWTGAGDRLGIFSSTTMIPQPIKQVWEDEQRSGLTDYSLCTFKWKGWVFDAIGRFV